ncbi:MAG: hypothetical protein PUA93_01935 [Eubacteriales bacterium]|nr:hypothetical protein [Eubacteriales bacterium]
MRKSLRAFAALGVLALSLTGCAKEVSYADFNSAAKAVESHTYKSCTVKGSYKAKSGNTTTDKSDINYDLALTLGVWAPAKTADLTDATAIAVAAFANYSAKSVSEIDGAKYYINGFKVVDGDDTEEFDKYGYITSYTSKTTKDNGDYVNAKLTFSWKD